MNNKPHTGKKLPENKLSISQLCNKWHCCQSQIYECIEDGMPCKRNKVVYKNGRHGYKYEFDLKECEQWNREGYFNSLSEKQQNEIISNKKLKNRRVKEHEKYRVC